MYRKFRNGGLHMTRYQNHDYANFDQFAPGHSDHTTSFCTNLKLFGSMKTELWAKEVEEFFIM